MRFEEKPDYAWVKNLFSNLYYKHEDQWDNVFDWSYIQVIFFEINDDRILNWPWMRTKQSYSVVITVIHS